jgi:hypothetical protein
MDRCAGCTSTRNPLNGRSDLALCRLHSTCASGTLDRCKHFVMVGKVDVAMQAAWYLVGRSVSITHPRGVRHVDLQTNPLSR